jgi:hypothetical protein
MLLSRNAALDVSSQRRSARSVMEVAGWIVFVVGALALFFGVGDFRDAEKRLLAHRLSTAKRLRDATPGELVKVRGRIAASEQGTIEAPVTGQQAVWFRVIGSEDDSTTSESSFRQFMDEVEDRAFVVVDADHAPSAASDAEVPGDPDAAVRVRLGSSVRPELKEESAKSSGPVTGVPPRMESFLATKGASAKTELGFERRREYKEERLSPGDEVLVIGTKPKAPSPGGAAYREVPEEPEALTPLLMTMKSEAELAALVAGEFSPGRATLAIGVTVVGVILLVLSR